MAEIFSKKKKINGWNVKFYQHFSFSLFFLLFSRITEINNNDGHILNWNSFKSLRIFLSKKKKVWEFNW